MTNILQIPFKKIRQEGNFKELLEALERGFKRININFYLVGATARDVWMRGVYDRPPQRATMDIDFAVMINDSDQFDELKTYLIYEEGFVPYHDNAFVLIWKDKTQIDLIPFGELENEGIVTVSGTGMTSLTVDGFKEVFDSATEEIETEGMQFKVCTLAGIVILKLIAWDDRPEIRRKDVADIAEIIKNYFHINSEAIWEYHSDLFTEENEIDQIAAQFLGREIGIIIKDNQRILSRIKGILDHALAEHESNTLIDLLSYESDQTTDFAKGIISHLLTGINEVR